MTRPAHRQGLHRKARNEQNSVAAYDLWIGGMSYADIAREVGCDKTTARDRVLRGRAMLNGDVEDKRDRVANEHFNDMEALRSLAESTEVETKDRIAAYNGRRGHAERLAKLYGLDAPVKTDVTSDGDKITIQVVQDWAGGGADE